MNIGTNLNRMQCRDTGKVGRIMSYRTIYDELFGIEEQYLIWWFGSPDDAIPEWIPARRVKQAPATAPGTE